MRILVLYLRHGTTKYRESLDTLRVFYSRLNGVVPDIIIIENDISAGDLGCPGVALGDNSYGEFSGWDSVLRRMDISVYDLVHFVTSAFCQGYKGYLDHFDVTALDEVAAGGFCLGHIDVYPGPCQLRGHSFQAWIRTCFFFLSPSTLSSLGSFIPESDFSAEFSDVDAYPFSKSTTVSSAYRNFLIDWLTGVPIDGVRWHSRISLDQQHRAEFKRKCHTILLEHFFSIRMKIAGVGMRDIGYRFITHMPLNRVEDSPERQALFRKSVIRDS